MAETTSSSLAVPTRPVATLASAKRQENIAGLVFISPAFLVLVAFLILPLLIAFYFSLTNWNGRTPLSREGAYEFVGFKNYEQLLIQGRAWKILQRPQKHGLLRPGVMLPDRLALVLAVIVSSAGAVGVLPHGLYFPPISSSSSMIFLFCSPHRPVNDFLSAVFPEWDGHMAVDNNGVFTISWAVGRDETRLRSCAIRSYSASRCGTG
jgi:ABC-type sugar transport system permease subunit